MKPTKRNVAILIPAHNEAVVLTIVLPNLVTEVSADDIFIVSDGSSDDTVLIAKQYTNHVIELKKNRGKAEALNLALRRFKLSQRYQFIMPLDADTRLVPGSISLALEAFEKHPSKRKVAVVMRVTSKGRSAYAYYRSWEYEVVYAIYKKASVYMGAMVVCPGCATIFASSLFKQITIPEGTLAEDMDLTFLIHRKKLGDIVYAPEAEVISEDPHSLADFVKQVRRWYTGFWQVILKYDIPWGGQMLDLEVGLIAIEGLFNGLFVVVLLTATWWLWWTNPIYVIIPLLIDLVLFMLPTMVWTMIRRERWRLPQYLLRTYLLRTISALVFVWGFLTVVFRFDQVMTWFSPKRKLLRERLVHGTT